MRWCSTFEQFSRGGVLSQCRVEHVRVALLVELSVVVDLARVSRRVELGIFVEKQIDALLVLGRCHLVWICLRGLVHDELLVQLLRLLVLAGRENVALNELAVRALLLHHTLLPSEMV